MANNKQRFFTSECVSMGHPDKICDQISDAVLDAILAVDPYGRVACETFVKTGLVMVGGEITTKTYVEIPDIVRQTIKEIGYTDAAMGFDYETCAVLTCIQKQSGDIAQGVDENRKRKKKLGAGDQGIMFGYACRETRELMPLPITLARRLINQATRARQNKILPFLRPDGKSQVTIEYAGDKPRRISAVVLSHQHDDINMSKLRKGILNKIIKPVLPKKLVDRKTKFYINPTGRFVLGGPYADSGLTGRKIMVDTYGSVGKHGGGAFSGKDPSKVDRSASYAARYAAKNLVAAGLADKCEVQLAYAIGVSEPVAINVDTFGTGKIDEEKLARLLRRYFSFSPGAIIDYLKLRRPIYKATARFGHFGRTGPGYTWEKTDKAKLLRKASGI